MQVTSFLKLIELQTKERGELWLRLHSSPSVCWLQIQYDQLPQAPALPLRDGLYPTPGSQMRPSLPQMACVWLLSPSNGKLTNRVLVLFVLHLQSTRHWVVYMQEKFSKHGSKKVQDKAPTGCMSRGGCSLLPRWHPATVFFYTRIRRERLMQQKPWDTKPLSSLFEGLHSYHQHHEGWNFGKDTPFKP